MQTHLLKAGYQPTYVDEIAAYPTRFKSSKDKLILMGLDQVAMIFLPSIYLPMSQGQFSGALFHHFCLGKAEMPILRCAWKLFFSIKI
ncbi:hypothetical protein [Acaryochloris sp. IP29b_bin.137]|uniref:hypothetical protein n=1 Tax=Acaryochloris sp. IP29b_bin.137 TaxID=2969217 RepID=UPI00262E299B|nr:hypothetical protein [Acaryochloris sp. IP29b_bin.137]